MAGIFVILWINSFKHPLKLKFQNHWEGKNWRSWSGGECHLAQLVHAVSEGAVHPNPTQAQGLCYQYPSRTKQHSPFIIGTFGSNVKMSLVLKFVNGLANHSLWSPPMVHIQGYCALHCYGAISLAHITLCAFWLLGPCSRIFSLKLPISHPF